MNKKLKALSVREVVEQLLQLDQEKICMVANDNFIPFPVKVEEQTFYKHPESDNTIMFSHQDDPDHQYIVDNYERIDAIVLKQDKG